MMKLFGKMVVEINRGGSVSDHSNQYVVITITNEHLVAILSNKVKDESCRGLYKYHPDKCKTDGIDII